MLRCKECGTLIPRSDICSDLGVLVLHWMSDHPEAYAAMHPETRPYLVEAGVL